MYIIIKYKPTAYILQNNFVEQVYICPFKYNIKNTSMNLRRIIYVQCAINLNEFTKLFTSSLK